MRTPDYPSHDAAVPVGDNRTGAVVSTRPRARLVCLLVVAAAVFAALVGAALWYGHARLQAAAEAEGRRRAAAAEAEERQQLADMRAEIDKARSELRAARDAGRKADAEYAKFRTRMPESSGTFAEDQAHQALYEPMIQYRRALAAYKEVRKRNDPRIDAILDRHPDWR